MLQATEVRKGHVVKWENGLWTVVSVTHITPGNWRAIIQIKLRNIQTGVAKEQRFSSSDKLEQAHIELVDMEYLYADGVNLVFMNQENFEQIPIHKDVVGEDVKWMKENIICKIQFYEGRVTGVELPPSVELKIVETEPGLKGATVTNVYKQAKLETGAMITVPPFIAEGEIVRVDTRSGEYMERVNK